VIKYLFLLSVAVLSTHSLSNTIQVAVVDTGLYKPGLQNKKKHGICSTGHYAATNSTLIDNDGHGTNVSGLIHKYARGTNYCQIIYKFWDSTTKNSMRNYIKILWNLVRTRPTIVNFSMGGSEFSYEERFLIKKILDNGTIIVASAGNHSKKLGGTYCEKDSGCSVYNFFPAAIDLRNIVVGNLSRLGNPSKSSNYGNIVDVWEMGNNVKGAYGKAMTGTSQAAAIYTGKLIYELSKKSR
jgi:hypothetical protein